MNVDKFRLLSSHVEKLKAQNRKDEIIMTMQSIAGVLSKEGNTKVVDSLKEIDREIEIRNKEINGDS